MRKAVKFLHTLASCGIVGAMLAHGLLLALTPAHIDLAGTRALIALMGTWLLVPSMAIVVMSGLLSMAVHQPFQALPWVWTKAALGFLTFLATLHLQGMTASVAAATARLAPGEGVSASLAAELATEGPLLAAVLALSVASIVLGVWRPRFARRAVG